MLAGVMKTRSLISIIILAQMCGEGTAVTGQHSHMIRMQQRRCEVQLSYEVASNNCIPEGVCSHYLSSKVRCAH